MNWQQVGKWITATSLALGAAAAFAQQGPVGTYPQVPVTTDATAQSTGSDNFGFCSTFGSDTTSGAERQSSHRRQDSVHDHALELSGAREIVGASGLVDR